MSQVWKDYQEKNKDRFLNEMLDLLCQDNHNKFVFKQALKSLILIKHELYEDITTCPMTKIHIVKINNKYSGGIFLFEFLKKYISMVNVMSLITTSKII